MEFYDTMTNTVRKRALYRLFKYIYLIIISFIFVDCSSGVFKEQHSPETTQDNSQPTVYDVKLHFDELYEKIGNRDSLNVAYLDLMQISGEDTLIQWQNQKIAELSFYLATYTQVSHDSSKMLYNRGREAASSLLSGTPQILNYLQDGQGNGSNEIPQISDSQLVDAVYWWATNTLFWYSDETPIARIVARKKLERAIKIIKNNNPDYRFAAVDRLRGLLLTFSPDGDLMEAQNAFEASIQRAENFVENRYMYARYYAVMLQNQQLFNSQMNKILAFDGKDPEGFKQLNALVQARAADYLDEETGFFIGKMPVRVNEKQRK